MSVHACLGAISFSFLLVFERDSSFFVMIIGRIYYTLNLKRTLFSMDLRSVQKISCNSSAYARCTTMWRCELKRGLIERKNEEEEAAAAAE